MYLCVCVCSVTQLCPTLCDPINCSPPGSSVHGILQARILEWVAISVSRDLSDPGIEPMIDAGKLYYWAMWEAQYEFIHADKPALRGAPTKVRPPVSHFLLPYHNTDRSSHGWALWWVELTLAPLLSSCLGASLISDLPKRKKKQMRKRDPITSTEQTPPTSTAGSWSSLKQRPKT